MAKLTDVTGIGPVTAKVLETHQIKTLEALAAANISDIEKIPGFSQLRAKAVKKAAKDCLLSNKNRKTSASASKQSTTKRTNVQSTGSDTPEILQQTITRKEKSTIIKNKKEKPKVKKKEKKEKKAEKNSNAEEKIKKNKIKKEKNKGKKKKTKKQS
ncbi:MAG: helix-hairpin-helix domain-containing protein [Burkholderiales bacterium]|nr:helix-hairpin-helix domain-containing protein [Burkholderiales bacterium]MDR4518687.1 helix-hairpin-helix domain-containing protein [Nitrosomonas sp.]